ncbi:MAG: CinA family protein [Blautia sp.]|nr:CinA family protein [Blautia sp.]
MQNKAGNELTKIQELYAKLTHRLIDCAMTITTMESCTGGLIASLLTDTEGSSAVVRGAFVTYSNEAKIRLGVQEQTILAHGVYSPETAREMAEVCRRYYQADIGLGVTGTTGNTDPANADSVPGQVWFAIDFKGHMEDYHITLKTMGSRFECKLEIVKAVAEKLLELTGASGVADTQ